jgi:excinuclease ABC subunit A
VGRQYESLWDEIRAAGYVRVRVDGRTYSLDRPPEIDRRRRHQVQVVIDRVVVKAKQRSRIADSIENALALGRGVLHVAGVSETLPESRWQVQVHSQHMACHRCGRSFEPLTPHRFSFNSALGWCESCQGLGEQTGANPTALLRDPHATLAQGALALWPSLDHIVARRMLEALADGCGLPLETPFSQLNGRQRRILMHGTGDQWFEVRSSKSGPSVFRFQFKGLYPALEEASRLSPQLRVRLERFVDQVECSACGGSRLRDDASAVRFRDQTIDQWCRMPLSLLAQQIDRWELSARERKIAGELVHEIRNRVQFLLDVGLEYLTLARGAATLSNGEAQRIRLASQLGSGLCGVLYVLDEPTIGLHPRDNGRLLKALHKLRDLGNTLLVVEHDREVIAGSDHLCDFGPGAGKQGGRIVASGNAQQLARRRGSVTGPYLNGKKTIAVPTNRRLQQVESDGPWQRLFESVPASRRDGFSPDVDWLEVLGARHRNLKNLHVKIPLGTLIAVTGVSGGGKSSLIDEVLYAALARRLHRASLPIGTHDEIRGLEHINKVIRVDQQPLGQSPASNPATYTGVFDLIRELFAQLPESKLRGYSTRRFSFNVIGGRCEDCEGNGQKCIEMHFLPDVWIECETCKGQRYNPETLAVTYRGHSINDVLNMTCGEALATFANIPKIRRILQTLCDVGLDYLTLGQAAPTLSGGEAQRVKLAAELARPDTGRTLYLLDEPTTGLHFEDLARLMDVLQRLVDLGNTVLLIEHNLDVIKQADWIIDLGPEAGESGGQIVAWGPPEYMVAHVNRPVVTGAASSQTAANSADSPTSHTATALAPILSAGPHHPRSIYDPQSADQQREDDLEIAQVGQEAQMPWERDGRRWHTRDRVGRKGEPCRWEGRILEAVVDHIQHLGQFQPTDWNSRGVVEITATGRGQPWFFHALTGETWLLKLKFRTSRTAVDAGQLAAKLDLKTLNQMDEIPLYNNDPRVRVKRLAGAWQEIEIRVHTMDEIDQPEFWTFLEQAVQGFFQKSFATTVEQAMPWKVLGRKWHLLRKGFPPGKTIRWQPELLQRLCDLLETAAPDGQFQWQNQQVVHYLLPLRDEPWASLHTKRPEALDLTLIGPKNAIGFGRVTELGWDRQLDASRAERDLIRLRFRDESDLDKGDLVAFLQEHLRVSVGNRER